MTASVPLPVVQSTPVPGLLVLQLPVHRDNRGWFKENWQREKMVAAGLPDFGPVQQNVSFNAAVGTTRGVHAEPWDKFVSVDAGRVFAAWVDLRAGDSFGTTFSTEITPDIAVFVPRGVGNAYQTLEPDTVYSYLVNDHWSPESAYTFLNLADETAAIPWPIALEHAERSERDLTHPRLADVVPVPPRTPLVLGANGQLGRALRLRMPHATFLTRQQFDVGAAASFDTVDWRDHDVVINASAYTRVDEAETAEGRVQAWQTNVAGVANLVQAAVQHSLTVVQVSSDYVFDGRLESHSEDESLSPLGVYGQTKAAADSLVATAPKHYIVRTSWLVGEGGNFVRTMARLAAAGERPTVVDDQVGRLSFADDVAAGIHHLIESRAAYGTYNLTNSGEPRSWADIAAHVFDLTGHDPGAVQRTTSAQYSAGRHAAPRPQHSTLALEKIIAAGFHPRPVDEALAEYLRR